jgi:hypothetical protein
MLQCGLELVEMTWPVSRGGFDGGQPPHRRLDGEAGLKEHRENLQLIEIYANLASF